VVSGLWTAKSCKPGCRPRGQVPSPLTTCTRQHSRCARDFRPLSTAVNCEVCPNWDCRGRQACPVGLNSRTLANFSLRRRYSTFIELRPRSPSVGYKGRDLSHCCPLSLSLSLLRARSVADLSSFFAPLGARPSKHGDTVSPQVHDLRILSPVLFIWATETGVQ
jgi:hypothetical protein